MTTHHLPVILCFSFLALRVLGEEYCIKNLYKVCDQFCCRASEHVNHSNPEECCNNCLKSVHPESQSLIACKQIQLWIIFFTTCLILLILALSFFLVKQYLKNRRGHELFHCDVLRPPVIKTTVVTPLNAYLPTNWKSVGRPRVPVRFRLVTDEELPEDAQAKSDGIVDKPTSKPPLAPLNTTAPKKPETSDKGVNKNLNIIDNDSDNEQRSIGNQNRPNETKKSHGVNKRSQNDSKKSYGENKRSQNDSKKSHCDNKKNDSDDKESHKESKKSRDGKKKKRNENQESLSENNKDDHGKEKNLKKNKPEAEPVSSEQESYMSDDELLDTSSELSVKLKKMNDLSKPSHDKTSTTSENHATLNIGGSNNKLEISDESEEESSPQQGLDGPKLSSKNSSARVSENDSRSEDESGTSTSNSTNTSGKFFKSSTSPPAHKQDMKFYQRSRSISTERNAKQNSNRFECRTEEARETMPTSIGNILGRAAPKSEYVKIAVTNSNAGEASSMTSVTAPPRFINHHNKAKGISGPSSWKLGSWYPATSIVHQEVQKTPGSSHLKDRIRRASADTFSFGEKFEKPSHAPSCYPGRQGEEPSSDDSAKQRQVSSARTSCAESHEKMASKANHCGSSFHFFHHNCAKTFGRSNGSIHPSTFNDSRAFGEHLVDDSEGINIRGNAVFHSLENDLEAKQEKVKTQESNHWTVIDGKGANRSRTSSSGKSLKTNGSHETLSLRARKRRPANLPKRRLKKSETLEKTVEKPQFSFQRDLCQSRKSIIKSSVRGTNIVENGKRNSTMISGSYEPNLHWMPPVVTEHKRLDDQRKMFKHSNHSQQMTVHRSGTWTGRANCNSTAMVNHSKVVRDLLSRQESVYELFQLYSHPSMNETLRDTFNNHDSSHSPDDIQSCYSW